MKAYTFIFLLGSANLVVPFLGISFIYKQYIIVALAVVTIMFAILLRTIAKEKENMKIHSTGSQSRPVSTQEKQKTIDEVIEMKEDSKRKVQKPKVLANSSSRYDE